MPLEIILTKDGSHSIYNSELNETYHSVGGALQESQFIYIDAGLKTVLTSKRKISVFEVGFGTGLNAVLTLKEAINKQIEIDYTTLEPFPLPEEIVKGLNYPSMFQDVFLKEKFYDLHSSQWNTRNQIVPYFNFMKVQQTIEEYTSQSKFDIVYFDAFAPSKQAEIWDLNNLKKVKELLKEGGILITYCSSGKFKRDLKEAGFVIESLPGPLGKREITRAIVIS
jgi:tRNA U34 5-methylaminomethyl-2-thiouridine-forming methyltransferase MnmC